MLAESVLARLHFPLTLYDRFVWTLNARFLPCPELPPSLVVLPLACIGTGTTTYDTVSKIPCAVHCVYWFPGHTEEHVTQNSFSVVTTRECSADEKGCEAGAVTNYMSISRHLLIIT